MTNTFLNSGGRSPSNRRAEAQARSAQRRQLHTPRNPFDENLASPEKSNLSVEDVSFYAGNSPQNSPRPCSISPCMDIGLLSPEKTTSFTIIETKNLSKDEQRAFGDLDCSSMDSGFERTNDSGSYFKFAEPCGIPPKRTPPKVTSVPAKSSPKSNSCFRPFNSLSSDSMDSMDEEYLLDMDSLESMNNHEVQKPSHFNSIICGDIKSMPELMRPSVRRCLSVSNANTAINCAGVGFEPKTPENQKSIVNNVTPYSSQIECGRGFKRPDTSFQNHSASKRHKYDDDSEEKENFDNVQQQNPRILRKSMSMNDANIMSALARCKLNFCIFIENGS